MEHIDIPILSMAVFDNKGIHSGSSYPFIANSRIFWTARRESNWKLRERK